MNPDLTNRTRVNHNIPDYPANPPTVKIKTTNKGRTRFGPNLYANGKVCL